MRELTRWLDRVDPSTPPVARLELTDGESLTLVEEDGAWRLDPSALDFYGQHTPRQCIRSFVRALERRRYDVLVGFAPARVRTDGLTAEQLRAAWEQGPESTSVQAMVRALRASTDRPIELAGERATMTYGEANRSVMQLVREDGLWRVEDPD